MRRILRLVLAAVCGSTGLAKMSAPSGLVGILGHPAFYSLGVIELLIALVLLLGRIKVACCAVVVICAGGLLLAWVAPSVECHCVGNWLMMSRRGHAVFASAIGALASWLLVLEAGERGSGAAIE